jgi:hypothetical protein
MLARSIVRLLAAPLVALALCFAGAAPTWAYVEIPYSLGRLVEESTHVVLLRVDRVDKTKNLILYRKVKDVKGQYADDVVKHNIGQAGFSAREWQTIMNWAEPGKHAVFMHNGSASETCIDGYWYQAYPNGEWWSMSHAEPYLLRSFAGKPEKLAGLVQSMLAGQEVITTCMVDGDKDALQNGTAKIQRLKASLKILDYDPHRDFLGWGGNEDFRRLLGMPSFSHLCELPRVDPGAAGIAPCDFDGDGKIDFCLFGEARVVLLQNDGKALTEFSLPYSGGARSADWADYNGDGRPDLLLATPGGPRLLTNLGESFRDDTAALPLEPYYHLSGAVWADADGDGLPDIVLANGMLGWRVYRNLGPEAAAQKVEPTIGKWHYCGPFDNTNRIGFNTRYPPELGIDLKAEYAGKNGVKAAWKEGDFTDGQVNSLRLFDDNNENVTCYLYREYNSPGAVQMPASFGSDDTLQVWINGERIIADNVDRACAPDQHQVTLKLKPGKNRLLLKVGQGAGDFAFYFNSEAPPDAVPPLFADATAELAPTNDAKATAIGKLVSADLDGDGRTDLLLIGKSTLLALGQAKGFKPVENHGLRFAGACRPAIGDVDGDNLPELFMPGPGGARLYQNLGEGRFRDVTAQSGALAEKLGANSRLQATSAAWASLDASGKPGLVVGCLKGPNRYFRHVGGGKFEEATQEVGLHQKVFNTRAIAALDFNGDGACDLLLNNEAQASVALLGDAEKLVSVASSNREP